MSFPNLISLTDLLLALLLMVNIASILLHLRKSPAKTEYSSSEKVRQPPTPEKVSIFKRKQKQRKTDDFYNDMKYLLDKTKSKRTQKTELTFAEVTE